MNLARIKSAAERIERNEYALRWLKEFGVKLTPQDQDGFSLTFTPAFARPASARKRPRRPLTPWRGFEIKAIIENAIRNCQNMIA